MLCEVDPEPSIAVGWDSVLSDDDLINTELITFDDKRVCLSAYPKQLDGEGGGDQITRLLNQGDPANSAAKIRRNAE